MRVSYRFGRERELGQRGHHKHIESNLIEQRIIPWRLEQVYTDLIVDDELQLFSRHITHLVADYVTKHEISCATDQRIR